MAFHHEVYAAGGKGWGQTKEELKVCHQVHTSNIQVTYKYIRVKQWKKSKNVRLEAGTPGTQGTGTLTQESKEKEKERVNESSLVDSLRTLSRSWELFHQANLTAFKQRIDR